MNTAPPLLQTKLHPPPLRADAVPRARLLERLRATAHLGQTVILVSAPAGFGKSTLLRAWADADEITPAWLALDDADNDPTRFWAHCIAALQTVVLQLGKTVLPQIYAPEPPPPEAIVALLVNDLAAHPQTVRLVLDDFHVLTNDALHRAFAYWLDHAPRNFQLALTTRVDPPLPLSRLRARGQLLELRADDLRFTPDEAAEFLNRAMSLALTPAQITALEKRTEGWIAGLQLAALSLRGTNDAEQFIAAFTGSHRYVMDYLVDEVLAQQSERAQNFLLETSLLKRFNAALCDAVLQTRDSADLIAQLERANLFLVALDDTREWFRYHHLFAELLRHRLHKAQPARIPVLHLCASEWFEQHHAPAEAIEHALAAQEFALAARWIQKHLETWFKQNELTTLTRWLDALPAAVLNDLPHLELARARIALILNRLDASALALDRAAERAAQIVWSENTQASFEGELAVHRCALAFLRGEADDALAWSDRALAALPPERLDLTCQAWFWRGTALTSRNEFSTAIQVFRKAQHASELAGDPVGALRALCNIGTLLDTRGELRAAYACFQEGQARAAALGVQHSLSGCLLALCLGEVTYEWNQLDTCLAFTEQAQTLAQVFQNPRAQVQAQAQLAQVLYARGEHAAARALIFKTIQLARDAQVPLFHAAAAYAFQIRSWLAENDTAQAGAWFREHASLLAQPPYNIAHSMLDAAYARVLLAQGDMRGAETVLHRALEITHAIQAVEFEIPIMLLLAECSSARGASSEAYAQIQIALSHAEPEGYVRTFLDGGEPVLALLTEFIARFQPSDAPDLRAYAGRLIDAFSVTPSARAQDPVAGPPFAPLTERELQVLSLMAQGMSNREISERLHITVATVKKHSGLLFDKLGVKSRTEAVIRAQQDGLI